MLVQTHSVQLKETLNSNVVIVKVTGKLEKEDYDIFVPELQKAIEQHGKIRILLELEDFHGWTAGAIWEDTKFDARHFNDIERIAFVGDKKWEHGMAVFCNAFTTAAIRYFDERLRDEAEQWIVEDLPAG